jgi:hypothetical protein
MPQGWQGRGKKSTAREARRQRHVYRRLIVNLNTSLISLGERENTLLPMKE